MIIVHVPFQSHQVRLAVHRGGLLGRLRLLVPLRRLLRPLLLPLLLLLLCQPAAAPEAAPRQPSARRDDPLRGPPAVAAALGPRQAEADVGRAAHRVGRGAAQEPGQDPAALLARLGRLQGAAGRLQGLPRAGLPLRRPRLLRRAALPGDRLRPGGMAHQAARRPGLQGAAILHRIGFDSLTDRHFPPSNR